MLSVTVTAADATGATASDTFDIVVANTNDAPAARRADRQAGRRRGRAARLHRSGRDVPRRRRGRRGEVPRDARQGRGASRLAALRRQPPAGSPARRRTATSAPTACTWSRSTAPGRSPKTCSSSRSRTRTTRRRSRCRCRIRRRSEGHPFLFEIPSGTFADIDPGELLDLDAMLASGEALPGVARLRTRRPGASAARRSGWTWAPTSCA